VVAMNYALATGASSWNLLDYRTSARASGDYDRVVGYAAVSMERAQ
ncbi:MAG: AmmeMemoRadiSam system protein B, partial [Candidatus Hydrogenedentes bacterium]|nr:AmmeMemoRadiSam system protein B [Candidatus Hydrogenedentota bacterium]